MKSTLLLTFLLLSPTLFAIADSESLMCPIDQQFTILGVSCCQEQLNQNACSIALAQIPPAILARTQEVQSDILYTDKYQRGGRPNCHWNAVDFNLPHYFDEARLLETYEYQKILDDRFMEIPRENLSFGDIIIYYQHYEERVMGQDSRGNPKMIWVKQEGIAHSAIYLSDDLVFQKENSITAVFSIDNLDRVKEVYQKSLNSRPTVIKNVRLSLFFYRKI